ncbi:MAG: CHASE domain-containing protein [Myxococcales bacterium]|nr:CHASE domain-containing protein [Myxococcales bacterium]
MGLPWWRKHLRPLSAASIGVVISFVAAAYTRRDYDEREGVNFAQRAGPLAMAMRSTLEAPIATAESIPPFFDASTSVDRPDFTAFVTPFMRRTQGIAVIEWFPYVRGEERAAYEARARREGVANFEFREPNSLGRMVRSPERSDYIPLFYMEPFNPEVIGLEMGYDPWRRDMLLLAARRGKSVVTDRFRLVEDPEGVWAVGVCSPIYAHDLPRNTEAERLTAWRGAAVVLFRPHELLGPSLIALKGPDRDVILLDEDASGPNQVLYESTRGAHAGLATAALRWSIPYTFCNHRWRFVVASHHMPSTPRVATAAVLAIGLLLTTVVTLAMGAWSAIARLRSAVNEAQQLGAYTLEEKLGEGGMGVVYRARHALLRRPTAVKVLNPERATDEFVARFEREVRATSELSHPNTIAVYDFGHAPDGTFYYAMEYLDGISLEDLVARFGPVPSARAIYLIKQVCGALAEAHARNMVHRDIKPANIMVCNRGGLRDFVKVLDFGLVKQIDSKSTTLSSTDSFIGTPLYMAPEAMNASASVGPASDLYALGGVLYFLLTGHPPFERGNLIDLCAAHLSAPPPVPSERAPMPVPPALDRLVTRCLAKRPEERPVSAQSLCDLLAAIENSGTRWLEADANAWWEAHRALVKSVPPREQKSL